MNRIICLFVLLLFGIQVISAQTSRATPAPAPQKTRDVITRIDGYMNRAVQAYHFNGSILVARGGVPIVKKSYGLANYELGVTNSSQTRFRLASITKQFTAMAVLILQERGKLSVGDRICKHLDNCPAAWQPITIRHLLTHTSGVTNHRQNMPRYAELSFEPRFSYAGFVDLFRNEPLDFAPGERFNYSNSGYFLLGLIIERSSGQTYADFIRDHIFTPLGMKNSGYDDSRAIVPNRAAGYNWNGKSFVNAPNINTRVSFAAGALYSTTEDLLLWDQSLDTEKLVSRKSLAEMFTPLKNDYGYGVEVAKRFNRLRIRHSGGISGFSNDFARFPEDRVTVIVLGNNRDAPSDNINNALSAIVFGEAYEMPKFSIAEVLSKTIAEKGFDAALVQFREIRKDQASDYNFSESALNDLGYELLGSRKVKQAIEIFKINVELYPQSFNAHDSLAEGYMVNGDRELAIKEYEKSLELNPQNKNGADMLKKLKGSN